jgi:radical SAM protein with 4Fe4S-binding SPASM domain
LSERIQKRWAKHYEDGNPFDLPNSVSRGVRDAASSCHKDETQPIQYLWVHYSSNDEAGSSIENRLSRDEWLGVIDEAVSMGARFAIVSLNEPLSDVPDLMSVAKWAQSTYNLMVGFHIHGRMVSRSDMRQLATMNSDLTRVFVESDHVNDSRFVEEIGVRVLAADGINNGDAMSSCDLPKSMTCVCSEGGMYTCGMVAGEEQYHMGNFLGRKLKAVLNDDSVPHTVREHESDASRQCSGCPPMMAQRIHEDTA